MQSGKTVTGGVVLRVTDTKETDRILTVLTADRGKIPLIARGARRKNSRLGSAYSTCRSAARPASVSGSEGRPMVNSMQNLFPPH